MSETSENIKKAAGSVGSAWLVFGATVTIEPGRYSDPLGFLCLAIDVAGLLWACKAGMAILCGED
jgi:hypothetical protein